MTDEEFDEAVQEAIDGMPQQFMDALDNVAIMVQDEPDPEQLQTIAAKHQSSTPEATSIYGEDNEGFSSSSNDSRGPIRAYSGELLGLYSGIPLTERSSGYELDPPDVITVFKGPHERLYHTKEAIVEQVRRTVVHEIGHYFGLDDDQLRKMGY